MKQISGYENYTISIDGEVCNMNTGRNMNKQINNAGYYRVALSKQGTNKRYFVHRLVAEAFIDNAFNLPQVNHKDGDKLNNNVNNLEWCDSSYNHKYSFRQLNRTPTILFDEQNGKTKIKAKDISDLVVQKESMTYRALGKKIGVNPEYLARVLKGKIRNEGQKRTADAA